MTKYLKFYSIVMLTALTLGAISGGLLALASQSNNPPASDVAGDNLSDFSGAGFLIADDGTYAGGLYAPQAGQVVYVAAAGDTIPAIATRFGISVDALCKANGMSAGDQLSGGEQLVIPSVNTKPNLAPAKPAPTPNQPKAALTNNSPSAPAAPQSPSQPVATQNAVGLDHSGGYTVQPGDTLSGIAMRYGVSVSDLANANRIVSLSQIYAGAKLTIPGQPRPADPPATITAPATTQPKPAASQPTTQSGKYTVKVGDNLSAIAAANEVTVAALVAANDLTDANMIYEGETLLIPNGKQPTVSQTPPPVRQAPAAIKPKLAPKPAPPTNPDSGYVLAPSGGSDRWIDVNISTQTLTAYEGDVAVFRSAASTGVSSHPTVVGRFAIYTKLVSTEMRGPGYDLPNVPYTMYFYGSYGIHGTYWHHNFGHPMSHGCVNLPTPAAAWMFNWAAVGTPVVTHY